MPLFGHHAFLHPPKPSPLSRIKARASMHRGPSPVLEFPYLPAPLRELMVSLLSTLDARLGSHLLPSSVPAGPLLPQRQRHLLRCPRYQIRRSRFTPPLAKRTKLEATTSLVKRSLEFTSHTPGRADEGGDSRGEDQAPL